MEGIGRGTFFLKEDDILTKNYNPEQFVLFPEGIGIYYEQYAIDCGAAGEYIFVIPSAPPPEKWKSENQKNSIDFFALKCYYVIRDMEIT